MTETKLSPKSWVESVDLIHALLTNRDGAAGDTLRDHVGDRIHPVVDSLQNFDADALGIIHKQRGTILKAFDIFSELNENAALANLLRHLEIRSTDRELLDAAIRIGLKGDPAVTHSWIAEYNVAVQRVTTIQTVLQPYIARHQPDAALFLGLKELEAATLVSNKPLLTPDIVHAAIRAIRDGTWIAPSGTMPSNYLAAAATRIVLPDETFNVLLWLALVSPDFVFDLAERKTPPELYATLSRMHRVAPVCMVVTYLGYPMGGGESFMHQTCRILTEFGIKCVWLSFCDAERGFYTTRTITNTPYYVDLRHPGGPSKISALQAINQFQPDIIHSQGHTNDLAMEIAELSRVNTLIGYHFWSGLVELGDTLNSRIFDNIEKHSLYEPPCTSSKLVTKYVASEFMLEVYERLGGSENFHVIHSISDSAHFIVEREAPGDYVLDLNVASHKGGEIFLECVRALGYRIPFIGVQGEPEPTDFPRRLKEEVARHPRCSLANYGSVKALYRNARIVMVPTMVDEVFCRVAFEAARNGIPVISTGNGNLPYMLGDTGVFLSEDPREWIDALDDLYDDVERLKRIGAAQRDRVCAADGDDFGSFIQLVMGMVKNSSRRNIGFFTVWGDQGLGNVAHGYTGVLREVGFRTHVFSFQPYCATGKALVKQRNPDEWNAPANTDSVYYSFNDRENVPVNELRQFILANNVSTLIVPEICWHANWERLLNVGVNGLAIYAIPMIEIVLSREVKNHNRLTRTLYNTRLAERVLTELGVVNGAFVGHGVGRPMCREKGEAKRRRLKERDRIRYLHVAGHNPTIRKNTPQILEAFAQALASRDDIELTVTVMKDVVELHAAKLPPGITIFRRDLSRAEIYELYDSHDVSIQVSSHEGLGQGFYESISRSVPVLSLDAPPHNEIVIEHKTGWLIPAVPKPLPDNGDGVVSAWAFDTSDLAARIVSIERSEIDQLFVSTDRIYRNEFDEVALLTRLLQVLPSRELVAPGTVEGVGADTEVKAEADAETTPRDVVVPGTVRGVGAETEAKADAETIPIDGIAPGAATDFRQASDLLSPVSAPPTMRARARAIARQGALATYSLFRPLVHPVLRRLRDFFLSGASELLRTAVDRIESRMDSLQAQMRERIESRIGSIESRMDSLQAQTRERTESRMDSLQAQMRETEIGLGSLSESSDAVRAVAARMAFDIRLVKNRLTSYAGEGVALAYLRDGSPIFVNADDAGCAARIIAHIDWEPGNLAVLQSFLKPDTIFVDVGANVGFFSIEIAKRLGENGRVLAFEPHPDLVTLIKRSLLLNNLERKVEVVPIALSDKEADVQIFYPIDSLGGGSIDRRNREKGKFVAARARSLDAVLSSDTSVDLVKVDVDGHELSVFRGMQGVLSRSPAAKILFEKLDKHGADDGDIAAFFDQFDMALYGVGPHSTLLPLDRQGHRDWSGYVLAARPASIDCMRRSTFSIYPAQLIGAHETLGETTRYRGGRGRRLFFGPNWYLSKGTWAVKVHGGISGSVRLAIVEEQDFMIAELEFVDRRLEAVFHTARDASQFEVVARALSDTILDLSRIQFTYVG